MAAESHAAPSAGEYIVHHLTHLANAESKGLVDFSVVHWDSVAFSVALGALGCWVMWLVARSVTSGVPGRLQAAVEFLVEMVDREAKGIVHNDKSRRLVAPMALTVFVWIVLLNTMDLLPVDLLPMIWQAMYGAAGHDPSHAYLRVVPTADISVTMGLSVAVLLACLIYNVKIKGLGGWSHELIVAPFGNVKLTANPLSWLGFLALAVANFAMQLLEFVSKTISHGMRLYGNM
ncbi:MAG TPA: FoF1 ATP synthase subunit a, partial [Burkholderiaceae bacterium]|nr:FoF1 ATP synthase subunit a [Burkholderiaceae bacterium]